ncbi:MFS transporter [Meiothermus granaticius]|uniref:Multidrug resistance protein n=1 Tax=Meiothermus granaticius NBRC 107808 TaxID=1227551 RepID=A0A399FBD5_9DEIN|nr:MFS transporter [Meiothermus granaticius]MCL6527345.1 MFS transporter [Thermaceae bacterium]RIH93460.1 multidrug resistance protein [Meiothermus granaticius NBRC 107808]GEM85953.1 MFS transporter [Meiothermus granaticius NBRC 107808]
MRAQSNPWYAVLSSYWFSSSFKWFLVLWVLLPTRIAELSPEPERAGRLGFLFIVSAVLAILGPPVFGYWSDRVGRRMPFIAFGAVITALSLVWMAFASSYAQLAVAYILLQLSDDAITGPYASLVPDLVARRRRGVASGWLGILQVVGSVVAGLVVLLPLGLEGQFLLIALINLLGAFLVVAFVREVPGLKGRPEGLGSSLLAPWYSNDFRWVWLTRFLVMLGQYVVLTYLLYYLADVVQKFSVAGSLYASEPAQATGLMGLLIALGTVLAALPAGRLSDHRGRKPVIYVAGGGLALLMLLFLIPNFTWLLFCALLFGALFGAYLSVDWALISDVLPNPQAHATDMGVWQISSILPQLLAGSLGAWLGSVGAQSGGSGYTLIFLVTAVCFALGAILIRQVRGAR